MFLSVLKFL